MNKIEKIVLRKGSILKIGGIPMQLDEEASFLVTEENKNMLLKDKKLHDYRDNANKK